MNKNTLTAFVLMALVVFGFMAYENYAQRNRMAEQMVLDSIARVEAQKEAQVKQKELEKKVEKLEKLESLYAKLERLSLD